MRRAERIRVEITREMVKEADRIALQREKKNELASTRLDTPQNQFIGDIAHQVVEAVLDTTPLEYNSTRRERYAHNEGDDLDIEIEGLRVDIKGTCMADDHFYVYAQNVHNPTKTLTHYLFVQLARDFTFGHIYGFVPIADFQSLARRYSPGYRGFNNTNYGIVLYKMPSFKGWLQEAVDKHQN